MVVDDVERPERSRAFEFVIRPCGREDAGTVEAGNLNRPPGRPRCRQRERVRPRPAPAAQRHQHVPRSQKREGERGRLHEIDVDPESRRDSAPGTLTNSAYPPG